MPNTEALIGENAGRVWHALHENGVCTTAQLGKKANLKPAEVHQAIGWLAREGKLLTETDGKNPKFRLVAKG